LAINPQQLSVPMDPWLKKGLPSSTPIHYCDIWSPKLSKLPGFGTLDIRASRPLQLAGRRLFQNRSFDLVYFSTTIFSLFCLGTAWQRRFGVPFVVDYQDPWITDYYRNHPEVQPPGGRLKYGVVDCLARFREPRVIRNCSGITAVSDAYFQELKQRYAFASKLPHLTIPFPGSERDLRRVQEEQVAQHCFDPQDGLLHWVCVGVSGPIMKFTLEAFFGALAKARQQFPHVIGRLRVHFIGTSYAPRGTGTPFVKPTAQRMGVGDLVEEQTDRIPYSEAVACLNDADALLALGSNDATYNASKLMPYLLARKPLLSVFHAESPASKLLREVKGSTLVTFNAEDTTTSVANQIHRVWFREADGPTVVPLNDAAIESYTERGQCQRLCRFFESILASGSCAH
jgi:hypothetical protein